MEPRITLITLGVADVARSRRFYETLGFVTSSASQESVAFLSAGGVVLALWNRKSLADDAGVEDTVPGFAGMALAHNARSETEVDKVLDEARAAGGRLVKKAHKVFWGGYSGYFADPDGHLWEVAYNPYWPLNAEGRVQLPPPSAP